MDNNSILALAADCGFEHYAPLDVSTLQFLPEIRAMCRADRCQSYGKRWSCPPALPELDVLKAQCAQYNRGLLVQSVGQREDEFDFEAILETEELHKRRFQCLTHAMRQHYSALWPMGAGACTICQTCTYPDAPCRFPEQMTPSMEALGLYVSQVCSDNKLAYYYGPTAISFTSCILWRDE